MSRKLGALWVVILMACSISQVGDALTPSRTDQRLTPEMDPAHAALASIDAETLLSLSANTTAHAERIHLASNTTMLPLVSQSLQGQTLNTCADLGEFSITIDNESTFTEPNEDNTTGGSSLFFLNTTTYSGNTDIAPVEFVEISIFNPEQDPPEIVDSAIGPFDVNDSDFENGISIQFPDPGTFDVYMRLRIPNFGWCPPLTEDPILVGNVVVLDAPESPEPASFTIIDTFETHGIDNGGILPYQNWTPLFGFSMTYPLDNPAPRVLSVLSYRLAAEKDAINADTETYKLGEVPKEEYFHQWALIQDGAISGSPDGQLDFSDDVILTTWDNHGYPYDMPNEDGEFSYNDEVYNLNFLYDPRHPDFQAGPLNSPWFWDYNGMYDARRGTEDWVLNSIEPNNQYFVAFQTSPLYPNGMTLRAIVDVAHMLRYSPFIPNPFGDEGLGLEFPLSDGSAVDNYSPDFFAGEDYDASTCFTSSFHVVDVLGSLFEGRNREGRQHNLWQNEVFSYTPITEYVRPRWDISQTAFEFVQGELMDIREVLPIEQWVPLLGIDIHQAGVGGGLTAGFIEADRVNNLDDDISDLYGEGSGASLAEVNLVFTDVGGDPYAPPGNGGFNPKTGLETITSQVQGSSGTALDVDLTFNGVGIFYDSNGDGEFQRPTNGGSVAVNLVDKPMQLVFPQGQTTDAGLYQWNYVPFPPGGGDPWWTIKLLLTGNVRAQLAGEPSGVDLVPETIERVNSGLPIPRIDYFVVARADSGFTDVSGVPGDGTGIAFGADTRPFIMPRRWNPAFEFGGAWDGGIWTQNQIAMLASYEEKPIDLTRKDNNKTHQDAASEVLAKLEYLDDPILGYPDQDVLVPDGPPPVAPVLNFAPAQPWWEQRTHTRDNQKIARFNLDVHDYVLTYSTDNRYGKVTHVMVGQDYYLDTDPSGFAYPYLYAWSISLGGGGTRTMFSNWMDPVYDSNTADFGIMELNFLEMQTPGVFPDTSDFPLSGDSLTASQYSFETVPFELDGDGIDTSLSEPRSFFFPDPHPQPTLPRYRNWPHLDNVLAFGDESYCFMLNEGVTNEEYINPQTSQSHGTYRDDEYMFVVQDDLGGLDTSQLEGAWLIDQRGARYRINRVDDVPGGRDPGVGLVLEHGHSAYIDRGATFADYPFGVLTSSVSIPRGRWMVVQDVNRRSSYPRRDDWIAGPGDGAGGLNEDTRASRAARLLKQHANINSAPIAMLGINLAGAEDPIVNNFTPISLDKLTVAFWGPEFHPTDLSQLDPDGALPTSGVLLYEDSDGDGLFGTNELGNDQIVPVEPNTLEWGLEPEAIDVDGDTLPDDLSGDGVFSDGIIATDFNDDTTDDAIRWDGISDLAWVLAIQPLDNWELPNADDLAANAQAKQAGPDNGINIIKDNADTVPDFFGTASVIAEKEEVDQKNTKALTRGGNLGDDLFVVINTSELGSAFEQFRCIIPSRLPDREGLQAQIAGLNFAPGAYPVTADFHKHNIEENPVYNWYGHDMLDMSVPARIEVITDSFDNPEAPVVTPGGPAFATLGVDISTNRPENLIAQGSAGTVSGSSFTVSGIDETVGAPFVIGGAFVESEVVGCWLIALSELPGPGSNGRVESFEITATSGTTLTLRSSAPADQSPWLVVKDPTFLEQVIVELYDVSNDGKFDPAVDLLPLNDEDPLNGEFSGLSIYRDNDYHPSNTNGVFDPPITDADGNVTEYIDLPVRLDFPPVQIGALAGEPEYQVKFVFSRPGTDNLIGSDAVSYESQFISVNDNGVDRPSNNRQYVHQSFGRTAGADVEFGSDFFVVVRTSRDMSLGDDFQTAIVSWGPNTPTEPDPDNFRPALNAGDPPGQLASEFDIFSEFPWGNRGLGFISFFRDPQPVYYWGHDEDLRKEVARQEVDESQKPGEDGNVGYWVRTNASISVQSPVITSLSSPVVDFEADRHRQATGQPVFYTFIATGIITEVQWNFGDGTTVILTSDDPTYNIEHIYNAPGVYDVSLTAKDEFGILVNVSKTNYIEIMDAPIADFNGAPLDGSITPDPDGILEPGLDVSFWDLSFAGDDWTATNWFFNFGDGETAETTTRPTEENPIVHRYLAEGFYTVTLEVTFVENTTGAQQTLTCEILNFITVRPCIGCPNTGGEGEGEGEGGGGNEGETEGEGGGGTSPPVVNFTATNIIPDKESLIPLTDWAPLHQILIGYNPDDAANGEVARFISRLRYIIHPDRREPADLSYTNLRGPDQTDILEFGIFQEFGPDEDSNKLTESDVLLVSWDAYGVEPNSGANIAEATDLGLSISYLLNFYGEAAAGDEPDFPILLSGPNVDGGLQGNSYIIAVRTSATWRSQITMGSDIDFVEMVLASDGTVPVNSEDGAPSDSFSPNFTDGDILEVDNAYSSSFGVWDITGNLDDRNDGSGVSDFTPFNFWNHPHYLYTPTAEHLRPTWNNLNKLLQSNAGEMLQLRRLLPMETFTPVIGINLHSHNPIHPDDFFGDRLQWEDGASLKEVNVVLTDIGADSAGAEGNGGFNPRTGLERMTEDSSPIYEPAFGIDYAFNGVWVWSDTNDNGIFDQPVVGESGTISFVDRPMEALNIGVDPVWEYIPEPPGGGDPWWKISLRFDGDERRPVSQEDPTGLVEAIPDEANADFLAGDYSSSEITMDYFVVVRTDSGFKDISLLNGDGSGIMPGADFRAFIEPRRYDANNGTETGGIYVDSMIPDWGLFQGATTVYGTWQDDLFSPVNRWGAIEPWFPQRTMTQDSAKPLRVGLEVHDLALTYESDNEHRWQSDLFFGSGIGGFNTCMSYSIPGFPGTDYDEWMDPFGLRRLQFLNNHSVGVVSWRFFGTDFFFLTGDDFSIVESFIRYDYDDTQSSGQFAYETVPFITQDDIPPTGPRSTVYPIPPTNPVVPKYATWPALQNPGEFPRASDWEDDDNQARLLRQKIDTNSNHTPVLGINVVGADDIVVNESGESTIAKMYVAFWGPDFTPTDLMDLDINGEEYESGVLLWEDADRDGRFFSRKDVRNFYESSSTFQDGPDEIVPLNNLRWESQPELIDVDGDGVPDDMDGNGTVDDADRAWVLSIEPRDLWEVPHTDYVENASNLGSYVYFLCGSLDLSKSAEAIVEVPYRPEETTAKGDKLLDLSLNHPGDDLFITIRTSDLGSRFEAIRTLIPARLPERGTQGQQQAGIQFFPGVDTSPGGFLKTSPEEDPVQDFYGNGNLEVNIATRILDMGTQQQTIPIGGSGIAVLGLDLSTNRGDHVGTVASGIGAGADLTLTVTQGAASWTDDEFAGDFLIDANYEPFRIVSNSEIQLIVESGRPADGPFRIVRDPSFLEEVVVELYNTGSFNDFNPFTDLLPLNLEQELSGIALYRDNDNDVRNRNGIFDPDIDIPVRLDAAPYYFGQVGEETKVRFVFSSPGTDNVPVPIEAQQRKRQWVYDSFGSIINSYATGPDFFVVVRASDTMQANDNFRLGIVNWGPNTPTEPDPDTWAGLTGGAQDEFAKFSEFPWGQRGLGYISFFKEPHKRYFMDGAKAGVKEDNSGFDWIRSHSSKQFRGSVVTAKDRIITPTSVVIESTSESVVPAVTLEGETYDLIISGSGFGDDPAVQISGFIVEINDSTDTDIDVSLRTPPGIPATDPVVVIVRNTETGEEHSRSDLLRIGVVSTDQMDISHVSPSRGDSNDFPIVIHGENFPPVGYVMVTLGNTIVPVLAVSEDGTMITVGYPVSGLPDSGLLNVTVQEINTGKSAQDILIDGFEFIVNDKTQEAQLFGCGPGNTGQSNRGDLLLLILLAAGLALTHRKHRLANNETH